MNEVMENIVAKAQEVNGYKTGDYLASDGLLYCGKCHNPKQVRIDDKTFPCRCLCGEISLEQEKEEKRHKENDERRHLCFSSPLLEKYRLEDLQDGKSSKIGNVYIDNWDSMKADGAGLLLWGNVGTGKSFLAAAIANAVIDKGESVRMRTAGEIVLETQDRPDKLAYISELCKMSLLVIDDLGAERETSFGAEIIYTLIDKRYESGKPMIFTTNTPLKEINEATDRTKKRIYDRILAVCTPVQLVGESKRKAIGADRTSRLRELISK